jgi:hypothetical protein
MTRPQVIRPEEIMSRKDAKIAKVHTCSCLIFLAFSASPDPVGGRLGERAGLVEAAGLSVASVTLW